MANQCSVEECDRPHHAGGYCSPHYGRWKRHGDPRAGRDRYATPEESFVGHTERRGDCLIWTGSTHAGYGQLRVDGRLVSAHRYSWERENGPVPEGLMIDHREHCDPRCVEPSHLRPATPAQNNQNRRGAASHSSVGKRNVVRWGKRFAVIIRKSGEYRRFGVFDTVEEAAEVAKARRAELFGEYAGGGERG